MVTITELQTIITKVRSLNDKISKEFYFDSLDRNILNFLGANIKKDGIAKKTAEIIPISKESISTMEDIIEIFDQASMVSKKKEKIRLMKLIILNADDREFVLICLFGSLKLGIKVPSPNPIFGENIKPMLCGTKEFDPNNSIIEQKFDGIRCIASNNNGEIILQSRNGKLINIPVVKNVLINTLPEGTTIDGEIVASDGEFQSLDRKGNNLEYQIYDILFINEKSIINLALKDRLVILNETIIENNYIKISKELHFNSMEKIDLYIIKNKIEGIVAKDPESTYQYGDRKNWMKYKLFKECSARVIDYTEGEGKREGIMGAINVIPENSNVITKCGSGFTDENLIEMKSLIDQDKNIIVNIKYFDITNDGCLRFPIFMNIRSIDSDELFR